MFYSVLILNFCFLNSQKVNSDWRELLVDIDPANPNSLRWIKAKNPTPALKLFATDFANIEGDQLEVCPQTIVHIESIVDRINIHDGLFPLQKVTI